MADAPGIEGRNQLRVGESAGDPPARPHARQRGDPRDELAGEHAEERLRQVPRLPADERQRPRNGRAAERRQQRGALGHPRGQAAARLSRLAGGEDDGRLLRERGQAIERGLAQALAGLVPRPIGRAPAIA